MARIPVGRASLPARPRACDGISFILAHHARPEQRPHRRDCRECNFVTANLTSDAPGELYPFESRHLDRSGLRYHYVDEGAGPPLVCVHGNPTWSFFFRDIIKAFRSEHRVVAPDHIGCGLSDKPGDDQYDYVLNSRVDDLEALLDHLRLTENVTLVLHDWGGMIGAACALRRPERIARLVVFNTAAFPPPPGKHLPWQLKLARGSGPLASVLVRGLNLFARGAAHSAVHRRMPRDVRRAYLAPYDSWANRIGVLRFVQDIPLGPRDRSYDLVRWVDDRLEQLSRLPTLICWGERDFVFDTAFLNEWRRRFPDAEVHAFADAGHYVLEDAADRIIPLMRDFLARHPIAAPGAAAAVTRAAGGRP